MNYDLVVIYDFGPFKVGDKISDPTLVASIEASTNVYYVVQVAHAGTPPGDTTAPTILTAAALTIAENTPFSIALTASEAVTWAKTGGADAALFTLTGATLSMAARDFETPTDANGDNAYVVTVTATDAAGNAASKTLTVTVTDVAEGGTAPADLTTNLDDEANSALVPGLTA